MLAKQRNPGARVVLLEGGTMGWAASGRNGGFCAASITHGEENGRSRWPDEYDVLERMGRENLDGIERAVGDLRPRLRVRADRRARRRDRAAPGGGLREAAGTSSTPTRSAPW